MQTYTGRKFYPLDPHPADINVVDIAHALSNICRYNGHTQSFYSVAQHSVLVSENVPERHAKWGLMHDAAEAYIGDMIRPIKHHFPLFKEMERKILNVVFLKFDLPTSVIPTEVHRIDAAILGDEKRCMMSETPDAWYLPEPPLDLDIVSWTPEYAKDMFLKRFREIF